jgi:hypothetical protein
MTTNTHPSTPQSLVKKDSFYSPLTPKEKREIFTAMHGDLRGQGHYYRCPNNHTVCIHFTMNILLVLVNNNKNSTL